MVCIHKAPQQCLVGTATIRHVHCTNQLTAAAQNIYTWSEYLRVLLLHVRLELPQCPFAGAQWHGFQAMCVRPCRC